VKVMKVTLFVALLLLGISQAQNTVKVLRLSGTDAFPAWFNSVAEKFTEETGIPVVVEELENEDFKKKLPTLLQTDEAPHIFYSWGGGVFYEQAGSGVTRDVTSLMTEEFLASQSKAGVDAFTIDGKVMGMAYRVSQVGIFYNRDLLTQAGVDAEAIQTWDDFLAAVQTVKDAGITPIAVGGADKWPLHFIWSYLAMRMAGQEGMAAAKAGEGDGFAGAAFVAAGEQFKRLIDLEPFQEGFETATYNVASGYFGDGKAAFHVMGDWDIGTQAGESESGKGLSEEQLGFISFPAVPEGAGRATDTLGGLDGFVFSENAPDEAVQFLQYFNNVENQLEGGKQDLFYQPCPRPDFTQRS
jgi:raffinose/stachyose/melibiose transport system substrate-binding protein